LRWQLCLRWRARPRPLGRALASSLRAGLAGLRGHGRRWLAQRCAVNLSMASVEASRIT